MNSSVTHRPVTRVDAGSAAAWMVVAAAATVLFTRLYLKLTGYPQVGGEIFHIAHTVWGGLLLMIAVVVAVAVANRWSLGVAAIVGGIGAGLFIDEIGKFITKDNDYFFPLAAPLAYAVLALFGVLALYLGSRQRRTARSHLYAALELSQALLDGPLSRSQFATLRGHVDAADEDSTTPQQQALLDGLAQALSQAEPHVVPDEERRTSRFMDWLNRAEDRLFPMGRSRRILRIALGALAALGVLGGPGMFAVALWQLVGPRQLQGNSLLGNQPGPVAWTAVSVAAVLGTIAGFAAWRAVKGLGENGDDHDGARWGMAALVLMLCGVNVVSAYFNQFYVLIDTTAQTGVLGLLARYLTRLRRTSA